MRSITNDLKEEKRQRIEVFKNKPKSDIEILENNSINLKKLHVKITEKRLGILNILKDEKSSIEFLKRELDEVKKSKPSRIDIGSNSRIKNNLLLIKESYLLISSLKRFTFQFIMP